MLSGPGNLSNDRIPVKGQIICHFTDMPFYEITETQIEPVAKENFSE